MASGHPDQGPSPQASEDRNSSRSREGTMEERNTAHWLCLHGSLACFVTQHRPTSPRVGWSFHQLAFQKIPTDLCPGQTGGGNYSVEVPSSYIALTCNKLTKISQCYKEEPKPRQLVLGTGGLVCSCSRPHRQTFLQGLICKEIV